MSQFKPYNPQRPASFLFRDLSDEEAKEFRMWTRNNYKRGEVINPVWHPVVQDECKIMNDESGSFDEVTEGLPGDPSDYGDSN